MKNADQPAYPIITTEIGHEAESMRQFDNTFSSGGLTKREEFARTAMQSMIEPDCVDYTEAQMDKYCHAMTWRAYKFADAMLEEEQ